MVGGAETLGLRGVGADSGAASLISEPPVSGENTSTNGSEELKETTRQIEATVGATGTLMTLRSQSRGEGTRNTPHQ